MSSRVKTRSLLPLWLALAVGSTQLLLAAPAHAAKKKHHSASGTRHAAPAHDPDDDDSGPAAPRAVDPNTPPQVRADSVLVFDARTGKVLYEKNADFRRPIASTQKLLTALIIAESGGLDAEVRSSRGYALRADQALLQARRTVHAPRPAHGPARA